jgi:hypothetical protein
MVKEYLFSQNKYRRKNKGGVKNGILFGMLLSGMVGLQVYVGGYMVSFIIIAILCINILSTYMINRMCKNIKFRLSVSDDSIVRDDNINVGLIIDNPTWGILTKVEIELEIGNEFTGAFSKFTYKMMVAPKRINKEILPLKISNNGIFYVKVNKIILGDPMATEIYEYPCDLIKKVCIIPPKVDMTNVDKNSYVDGINQNEENLLKGSDFSDVSNVREYIPGDRIRDIHWKLSAKKDELMVKERVRLSERQLVILADLEGDNEKVDEIVTYVYNFTRECILDGIPVKLIWWNDKISVVEEYEIYNDYDIKKGLMAMYETGKCRTIEGAFDYIRNVMTKLKGYIYITQKDGEIKAISVEQG